MVAERDEVRKPVLGKGEHFVSLEALLAAQDLRPWVDGADMKNCNPSLPAAQEPVNALEVTS